MKINRRIVWIVLLYIIVIVISIFDTNVFLTVISIIFWVNIGNFVKLFFPVERIRKQINGKINNKNNTTLFFVRNFMLLKM